MEILLGSSSGQPVHFIGHSLGTLVNAGAANYLHEKTSGAFDPQNTQMTLLDDAEAANFAGTFIQLSYTLTGVYAPYQLGNLFTCGWVSPVPHATVRWMDNYISLVGLYHVEAVNTFLAKAPDYADKTDLLTFVDGVHGYSHQWYAETATTPDQSLLGNRYSFERLGSSAQFPNPAQYPLGSLFSQDFNSSDQLALVRLQGEQNIASVLALNAANMGRFGLQQSLDFAAGVAQQMGTVAADVVMSFIPTTPTGTPVFTGTADSTPAYYTDNPGQTQPVWSFQFNLQTTPSPLLTPQGSGPHPQGGGGTTTTYRLVSGSRLPCQRTRRCFVLISRLVETRRKTFCPPALAERTCSPWRRNSCRRTRR